AIIQEATSRLETSQDYINIAGLDYLPEIYWDYLPWLTDLSGFIEEDSSNVQLNFPEDAKPYRTITYYEGSEKTGPIKYVQTPLIVGTNYQDHPYGYFFTTDDRDMLNSITL